MFKTTTKTIKSLPKTKYKRRGERNEDAEPREKMNQMGGGGVLYSNFSDGITDGHLLLSVALNSVSN
jgi:hypothetical protein